MSQPIDTNKLKELAQLVNDLRTCRNMLKQAKSYACTCDLFELDIEGCTCGTQKRIDKFTTKRDALIDQL